MRSSEIDVEIGDPAKTPNPSKLSLVLQHVKPGPKSKSCGKIMLDLTTNFILPAMDEVSDIISGVKYAL